MTLKTTENHPHLQHAFFDSDTKEFIFPVRVYYEDTDVAGVVYYANYLKFYERGRTEWLRSFGLDQDVLVEQGIAFAVARAEVDYLRPARFNDALQVRTKVTKLGKARVEFTQRICQSGKPDTDLSRAIIKVACVNLSDMRPRPMPEIMLEAIKSDD